jgi:hypothetical protein
MNRSDFLKRASSSGMGIYRPLQLPSAKNPLNTVTSSINHLKNPCNKMNNQ